MPFEIGLHGKGPEIEIKNALKHHRDDVVFNNGNFSSRVSFRKRKRKCRVVREGSLVSNKYETAELNILLIMFYPFNILIGTSSYAGFIH